MICSEALIVRSSRSGQEWNSSANTVYAIRTMRRYVTFAVSTIIIVALAIGGNTAMFTVIRAVLLKPLECPEPDSAQKKISFELSSVP
jgi:hypothetical protein